MKLTYIKQAGEPNGDAGDQYTGLDRFGRVVDQRWPEGSSELERVDYGFTAASNRQWRQNRVASNGQDEYYNYDGLYQVAELNRGTLNGGKTAISGTPSWTEDFTYDPIGNWDAYLTKVSGVTDLDQSRTHNTANETVAIDGSTATVAHDLAGNMVKVPQVADWETTFELKWDAWNRLVEVSEGETVVAEYRYDGRTRRVSKETDDTRHYYYSDRWQILEERVNGGTNAERQFVWGQRFLDDLVLRIRGSECLYVLNDYLNPTAIADEDGVVVERYGYNAFGLSRVMAPNFSSRTTSLYDWETRFGAYRYDAETGLYQVRCRYLHPSLGRWLSRDPITEAGGFNLYESSANNPVRYVDVYGRDITDWKWIDPAANFAAGVSDALTMGLTFLARDSLKWNDQIDTSSGAYIAGEIAETSVEVIVTFGGAGLRKYAARKTTQQIEQIRRNGVKAYRRVNKAEGGIIHHYDPLKGHPPIKGVPGGNKPARYPMPFEWEGNGIWKTMTKVNNKAEHDALHLALMRMEALDKFRESTLLVRQAGNRIVQAVNDAGVAAQNKGECPPPVAFTIEAIIASDRTIDLETQPLVTPSLD